jgi:hypothetical protein
LPLLRIALDIASRREVSGDGIAYPRNARLVGGRPGVAMTAWVGSLTMLSVRHRALDAP